MSLEAMTWALSARVGDPTRKLVLVGMANHAHRDGTSTWASRETIADYVECHPKTVRRHVQQLVAEGWVREGDQRQVAHMRADRRPIVYDLAMTDATRAEWAAAAAGPDDDSAETVVDQDSRGDNVSPRDEGDDRTQSCPPVEVATGGHTGGHRCPSRGDTAVSPEPSLNPGTPPQPPDTGGASAAAPTPPATPPAAGGRCMKPGPTPHPNCRGCGTTNRQTERAAAAAKAERIRAANQAAIEADRARVAAGEEATEARRAARAATRNAGKALQTTGRTS